MTDSSQNNNEKKHIHEDKQHSQKMEKWRYIFGIPAFLVLAYIHAAIAQLSAFVWLGFIMLVGVRIDTASVALAKLFKNDPR